MRLGRFVQRRICCARLDGATLSNDLARSDGEGDEYGDGGVDGDEDEDEDRDG